MTQGQLDSQNGARARLRVYDASAAQLSDPFLDSKQAEPSHLPRIETLPVILDRQT
jgi:hypothetical protein